MGRLFVILQYLLPHHLLGRIIYFFMRIRVRWIKNLTIGGFARVYRPAMSDAIEPDPLAYPTFNAFFTRALKADARPLDPDPQRIVSPCDGTLSVAGVLAEGRLVQAKNHDYTIEALLAGNARYTQLLSGGQYATIYLAPYNYHRLHMPAAGRLLGAWYVPGRVFSVNTATVARVPGLFARNERVVCVLEGSAGPFVLVLVGALFVGSMATVWHDEITPWRRTGRRRSSQPIELRASHRAHDTLARGEEFARFNMGSTIVMLFPPATVEWDLALQPELRVSVGQGLGSCMAAPASR
ncbi:MAG TPA: archaetidylserine decarboxylase [Steroidobacteraceae bacterium]|jgi:phosphatidylserine decarboxylase|nr:archaetidylserine decarboxylase [Steroidobacteraceae bacterium]